MFFCLYQAAIDFDGTCSTANCIEAFREVSSASEVSVMGRGLSANHHGHTCSLGRKKNWTLHFLLPLKVVICAFEANMEPSLG